MRSQTWTKRLFLIQPEELALLRLTDRCPQRQKIEPDRHLGPNLNTSLGLQASVLRGLFSNTSIWAFPEEQNTTPLLSRWEPCYSELCQNLWIGETCRAPEPPPHSRVSMETNPHYDPSEWESISTQPPGELGQSQQIESVLSLGAKANARWGFQASILRTVVSNLSVWDVQEPSNRTHQSHR